MKYCPNCGFPLNEKYICECGYNGVTREVTVPKEKNLNIQNNNDNPMDMNMYNKFIVDGAHKMGVDSLVTDEDIVNQHNQLIFNKENDNITDLSRLMELKDKYDKEK